VTLNDRIERSSFAYDADFPPDVPEGQPLSSICPKRPERHAPLKRALNGCARLVTAARRA
jgi:hypothetical protein